MKPLRGQFMKQNEHFLREHGAYRITTTPMSTLRVHTTIENFQINVTVDCSNLGSYLH